MGRPLHPDGCESAASSPCSGGMKQIDSYLRLADLCEREAFDVLDPRDRRQFVALSQAIRTWIHEGDDEPTPRQDSPPVPDAT